MNNSSELLELRDIHKSFGNNKVLKGIDLKVNKGEVISLIGGNGAGKSTLMKIIVGHQLQDKGEMFLRGSVVSFKNPSEALDAHIYMVPQEPMIFSHMTVFKNITMGINGDNEELRKRVKSIVDKMEWDIDLEREAFTLSIAEHQLLEIARGLLRDSELLILDEPTSSLSFEEVKSLFKLIDSLKQRDVGIIYITHRLPEVFAISDKIAVMRDGKITLYGDVDGFTNEDLIVGLLPEGEQTKKPVSESSVDINYMDKEPVFELSNYTGYGFSDINLKIYPGEILGISGMVGAGRTELACSIIGIDNPISGKAYLNGKDITNKSIDKIIKCGISYVPENRGVNAIFKNSNITSNMVSSALNCNKCGKIFIDKSKEEEITKKYVNDFRVKTTNVEQYAGTLSGGNQQKIIIGRCLSTDPSLVILDEPTRGIDAGARADVYEVIRSLRKKGVSIMLISSDMEEIVQLSDRVVSIYRGHAFDTFSREEINEDDLMSASLGISRDSKMVISNEN